MSAGIDAGSGLAAGAVVVGLGADGKGAEVVLADSGGVGVAVGLGADELPPRAPVDPLVVQAPSSSAALRAAAT